MLRVLQSEARVGSATKPPEAKSNTKETKDHVDQGRVLPGTVRKARARSYLGVGDKFGVLQ